MKFDYFSSPIHIGYMDGLSGKDPDEKYETHPNYVEAYVAGLGDKEEGVKPSKYLGPCDSLPFKRGDSVKIPKGTEVNSTKSGKSKTGRTYNVKLHDVYNGVPAYIDAGVVIRPEAPKLLWAGSGGYWKTANINDIL